MWYVDGRRGIVLDDGEERVWLVGGDVMGKSGGKRVGWFKRGVVLSKE